MCRYRRVRNQYTRCGHGHTIPEELIVCYRDDCIFSPNHPANCTGDECKARCWHYRQFPQQYAPNIDGYCPDCVARGMR